MILLALALAAAPPAPATPTAREVVERQLAKTAPARSPRLSAAEAEAIRARYLKRIGEPVVRSDDGAQGASRSR